MESGAGSGTPVNQAHLQHEERTAHSGRTFDRYISQVLPDKKDIVGQTQQLNWWKTRLGDSRLSTISPAMISECRSELQKGDTHYGTPRSAATVNRYLAALSHAFTIAWKEWGWINFNPVLNTRKLKEPRDRVRFLDEQERERLLKACRESRSSLLYKLLFWFCPPACARVRFWD